MAFPSATRLGKRIVNYPDESVPVVSSTDWLGWFSKDPKHDVSRKLTHIFLTLICPSQIKNYLLTLFPILTWITRYSKLVYGQRELELHWYSTQILVGWVEMLSLVWPSDWSSYPRECLMHRWIVRQSVRVFVLKSLWSLLLCPPSTDFTHLSLVCSSIV